MGNTVISPNIRKESVRIDTSGNIINPRTKQIVQAVEPEYVPPVAPSPAPIDVLIKSLEDQKPVSKIDEMINNLVAKKIEELVAKKVEEALSKL